MSMWTNAGREWQQPEPGNHIARCIRVIDLGTQRKEYQGKVSFRKQTYIVWELPAELMEDGKPHTISKFYTASLNEKANMRRDLENWRGKPFTEEELKGFDSRNILGVPCLLNVILDDKGKTEVGTVSPVPKGMAAASQVNESLLYDIDEHDEAVWLKLSPGIQRMILGSEERKAQNVAVATTAAVAGPVARPHISSTSPLTQAQRRLLMDGQQVEETPQKKAPPRKTRSKPQPQTTTPARFVDDVDPTEPVAADAITDKDLPF